MEQSLDLKTWGGHRNCEKGWGVRESKERGKTVHEELYHNYLKIENANISTLWLYQCMKKSYSVEG